MNKNNNTTAPPQKLPPTELIGQFLQNQAKELEIRSRELELQKQQDSHNFQYAQAALTVQATDRNESRAHDQSRRKTTYYFVAILVCIVVGFLIFALYLGKDAVAMEVIKAILYILTGGSGGYALGARISRRNKTDDQET